MDTQEQPRFKGLYIKLDPETHKAIKLRSVHEETTISALIREALRRCYGVAA